MNKLSISEESPRNCLDPCTVKTYQSKRIGSREIYGRKGLIIFFENQVDVTKSSWQIDEISFLSKIGGFIGISKNFLWLTLLFLSALSSIVSFLKLHNFTLMRQNQ